MTEMIQLANQTLNEGANITIPTDQLPAIVSAIIATSVQAQTIYFFIGVTMGAVITYLYMKMIHYADKAQDKEEVDP